MSEYRIRARRSFLTTQQLDEFNKICKTGKETIEWHSPNWVAMSRNQYEKLAKKSKRAELKMFIDEFNEDTLMNKDNPSLEEPLGRLKELIQQALTTVEYDYREAHQEVLQAITKYIEEEIIGADDNVTRPSPDFLLGDVYGVERNGLRAEQRAKLRGGGDE